MAQNSAKTADNPGKWDRSIRIEDFQKGQVFPKRYRNRRLGDFLKELELTEGRATGIPVILEALKNNGSPDPIFETDAERTWFQVKLPVHTAFLELNSNGNTGAIDDSLREAVKKQLTYQLSDQLSDDILDKAIEILLFLQKTPGKREDIMNEIKVKNYTKSARRY